MRGFPAGIWLILTLSLQLVDLEATKKNPLNEPDVPFPPAQPTAENLWKQALHQFCAEEYGTMTTAYDCCGMKGDARWACFNEDVSNPDYEPTPGYTAPAVPLDLLFIFTTQSC
ncbi:uncharacterized protein ecm1a isoform X2 [Synchiropus splendidus]|uniref:uncharacterized protein ecm1a isoform X2 n=1 Tax=Synchiropus splendidus TaxID=270530 RepID=UPI00237D7E8F|nr:uncharacterized protein ecm1a isoform X2 [Synchiropus splendidus]